MKKIKIFIIFIYMIFNYQQGLLYGGDRLLHQNPAKIANQLVKINLYKDDTENNDITIIIDFIDESITTINETSKLDYSYWGIITKTAQSFTSIENAIDDSMPKALRLAAENSMFSFQRYSYFNAIIQELKNLKLKIESAFKILDQNIISMHIAKTSLQEAKHSLTFSKIIADLQKVASIRASDPTIEIENASDTAEHLIQINYLKNNFTKELIDQFLELHGKKYKYNEDYQYPDINNFIEAMTPPVEKKTKKKKSSAPANAPENSNEPDQSAFYQQAIQVLLFLLDAIDDSYPQAARIDKQTPHSIFNVWSHTVTQELNKRKKLIQNKLADLRFFHDPHYMKQKFNNMRMYAIPAGIFVGLPATYYLAAYLVSLRADRK